MRNRSLDPLRLCGLFASLCLTLLSVPASSQPLPAPPAGAPQSVAVLPTIIPFELVGDHIMLHVLLNGKGPYWFALDTGAYNCLTAETARALGVPRARWIQVTSVQIGTLSLRDQKFAQVPLPDFDQVEGVSPFGGLIGIELFRQYVVRIDYEHRRLTLTPPGQFHYTGTGIERDLTFLDQIPQITARLDGVDGTFNIDTGDRRSLAVFRDFREQFHPQAGAAVQAMTGWGVRGSVWSQLSRGRTFAIGDAVIDRPLVEQDLAKGGAFDFPRTAGNIGARLLEQFNITFDYSRKQAFFEKNAAFGQPTPWDRSGLWLNQNGPSFTVIDVTAGGPAALAGVGVGDTVTAVNSRPASQYTLSDLRLLLRQSAPGSRVLLTVRPKGAAPPRDVTLVLKELV